MKAITTKYLPCTDTLPARIKASCPDIRPLTVSVYSIPEWNGAGDFVPHGQKSAVEWDHFYVANKLRESLKWDYSLVGGWTVHGTYAWVLLDK